APSLVREDNKRDRSLLICYCMVVRDHKERMSYMRRFFNSHLSLKGHHVLSQVRIS
ncbi:unnamed protein product, partial [Musa acuminata var. zebrina]